MRHGYGYRNREVKLDSELLIKQVDEMKEHEAEALEQISMEYTKQDRQTTCLKILKLMQTVARLKGYLSEETNKCDTCTMRDPSSFG